jgi:phage shock protein PspC (stress-responsive transcriptional regulator)
MAGARLYRSRTDRKVAGVCGGLAEFLEIDPTIVRVVYFLALVVPGGIGVLPYIVLWIILPEGPDGVPGSSPAISIAEERFARGEITVDELARIKEDLST